MLAFPDCQMLDVTGPLQMLAGVNDELRRQAYELVIAAPRRGPFKTSSGVSLVADLAIADVRAGRLRNSDTLVAAGGEKGLPGALESGEIAALIKAAGRRGCRIVSVCSGAFFLAAAGVLDGRRAATHWRAVERLRQFRPQVDVIQGRSTCVTGCLDIGRRHLDPILRWRIEEFRPRHRAWLWPAAVVFRIQPGGQGQFSAAQGIRDRLSVARRRSLVQEDWRTDALASEAGLCAGFSACSARS